VVATRVGGIPEVLPPYAGAMVPPRDVPALAEALFTALGAEWDRPRITGHARSFDWDTNVSRLRALIEDAAQRTSRSITT
jgi:glycosyltransferase involved in cell wall biosynthesis